MCILQPLGFNFVCGGMEDPHPNYPLFCRAGISLVLAVFKAWQDCSGFHACVPVLFICFWGLEILVEMSDSESELSFNLKRNVTNKRAESELQSLSKCIPTQQLTDEIDTPHIITSKAGPTQKTATANEDSPLVQDASNIS